MRILAIETSCDDTGIAILETPKKRGGSLKVLSNVVASQIKIHQKYGGVYPMMAKREHQKNLVPTLIESLKGARLLTSEKIKLQYDYDELKNILEREPDLYKKLVNFLKNNKKPNIDSIAVTNGPGLEPCLWVGVNFAKALSYIWNIPIVPVNHIEAHILVNFLKNKKIKLPTIALVVSGGHTQIILAEKPSDTAQGNSFKYQILGETRDDAAGECFDKCAKIMGLGYPGGPIIANLARDKKPNKYNLPRPMITTKDYDFSFSGLKTAVLYAWQKENKKNLEHKKAMSAEIQQATIDVLLKKTFKAVRDFGAKSLILGGGVSANQELKKQFGLEIKKNNLKVDLVYPEPKLSTDNGLMIAVAGFYRKNKQINWKKLKANGNLRIK